MQARLVGLVSHTAVRILIRFRCHATCKGMASISLAESSHVYACVVQSRASQAFVSYAPCDQQAQQDGACLLCNLLVVLHASLLSPIHHVLLLLCPVNGARPAHSYLSTGNPQQDIEEPAGCWLVLLCPYANPGSVCVAGFLVMLLKMLVTFRA